MLVQRDQRAERCAAPAARAPASCSGDCPGSCGVARSFRAARPSTPWAPFPPAPARLVLPTINACDCARQCASSFVCESGRIVRRALDRDELDRNHVGALMQHLKVGVLRVRARLAPHDRAGREGQRLPVEVDAFAVALHLELLQIRGQSPQPLVIGRDTAARVAMEVAIPHVDAGRAAPADCSQAARSRSGGPSRARRRASRESCSAPMAIAIGKPIADHSE